MGGVTLRDTHGLRYENLTIAFPIKFARFTFNLNIRKAVIFKSTIDISFVCSSNQFYVLHLSDVSAREKFIRMSFTSIFDFPKISSMYEHDCR